MEHIFVIPIRPLGSTRGLSSFHVSWSNDPVEDFVTSDKEVQSHKLLSDFRLFFIAQLPAAYSPPMDTLNWHPLQ